MAPSIGLNLRVTGYKHQGGRKYMEDEFGVAYQQTADEKDLEYAFFGIFDGHGGREAALFAKVNFYKHIIITKVWVFIYYYLLSVAGTFDGLYRETEGFLGR